MRTSFHHQPEAQHPKSPAIYTPAGRLPHLWVNRCASIQLPRGPLSVVTPIATFQGNSSLVRKVPEADIYDHIKPGLRGRYCVQSPNPGDAISSIGKVMRMPCLTARLSALSHVPGRNADICSEPPSAAIFNAVVKASPRTSARVTARGPIWPSEPI